MLRMKPKVTGMSLPAKGSTASGGGGHEAADLEIRPGRMLVQKRNSDSIQSSIPIPTIRVRVKHGSSCHEIKISARASFGELKKMLAGPTGLDPQDQKLTYKDKDRDSKNYLDVAGLKDGSEIVLVEDVMSRERWCLKSRKNSNMNKALEEIAVIGLEVDKLAKQVATLESEIYGGKKVMETVLSNLIELLMTQLIKLDGIVADGDVKLYRRMQVKRVQKYIETLDMLLKTRNSLLGRSRPGAKVPLQQQQKISTAQMPLPFQKQQEHTKQKDSAGASCGNNKFGNIFVQASR